jgi:hypothetical protein
LAVALSSPLDATPLAVSVSLPVERIAAKRALILEQLFHLREQFSTSRFFDEPMGV